MVDSKDSCACTYLIPVHTSETSARKEKKSFSGGYLMLFDFTLVKQTQEKSCFSNGAFIYTGSHATSLIPYPKLCLSLLYKFEPLIKTLLCCITPFCQAELHVGVSCMEKTCQ